MMGYCNPCGRTQTFIASNGRTVCASCLSNPYRVSVVRTQPPPRFRLADTGPCPCECNSGGFCGGCGHAGCGGR